ncbi:MAG: protoporphyrinogen/coproporphyrinogen oxidase [Pseudonocardiaceae bacterium]
MTPDLDVAVVGGGIAGLAVAYALQQAGRSVQVFEAADGVGGRMRTLRHNGYVINAGAEIIATHGYPATWRLIREMGMGAADVPRLANPISMWRGDRAHPHMGRPLGLLTGAGLSPRARLDLLRLNAGLAIRSRTFDPDHPERTPLGEMSVAQLTSGYHRELRDYLFQPLVGGFFGCEVEQSAAASVVTTMLATKSTANWRTYRDGMDTLARRLAKRLDVTTGCPVREVTSAPDCARIITGDATLTARSVALCVPAPVALDLHANAPEDERRYLGACTYTPMLKVSCVLDRPLALPGCRSSYAVFIPEVENPLLSLVALDHNQAFDRAPGGHRVVCMITSPRATSELLGASDEEVVRRVTEQGERYLPGLRQATRLSLVHRFRHGMPTATPAALRLRGEFLCRPLRTVDYAGDWVTLPNSEGAARSADLAVWRVLAQRSPSPHRSRTAADHG